MVRFSFRARWCFLVVEDLVIGKILASSAEGRGARWINTRR